MTREEFWEWLATCPTHKYEATDEFGYVTVTFKVDDQGYAGDLEEAMKGERNEFIRTD